MNPPHIFSMERLAILLTASPIIAPSAWGDMIYSSYQNIAVP